MCSIIASFDKDKLKELAALNEYRGTHSHSISFYSLSEQKVVSVHKGMGPLPVDQIHISPGYYCICHQQAPTGEMLNITRAHPAAAGLSNLWHNGILKPATIERLKQKHNAQTSWDTALFLYDIVQNEFNTLSEIDGTFACILALHNLDKNYPISTLFLFRNELAPLFVDDKYNVSSTKFEGSRSLEPNVVWQFEPGVAITDTGHHFKTKENPYYFG
mgnify:CR=1 FL=1